MFSRKSTAITPSVSLNIRLYQRADEHDFRGLTTAFWVNDLRDRKFVAMERARKASDIAHIKARHFTLSFVMPPGKFTS
jgi:hypothetical protein